MLTFYSLERPRCLTDVFQLINNTDNIDIGEVLLLKPDVGTHRNGYKLDRLRFRKEIGTRWLLNIILDEWNKLGRYVTEG